MTTEHKFTHGKRTFASQDALDLYAASRAAKQDQPSWPLWWKILLWVTGIWLSLYFLGGGKTTPTAPVEERYSGISEDSKSKAALLINLARWGNLWVTFSTFLFQRVWLSISAVTAPAVDKSSAHRTSLWTAAARCMTCPPLPGLVPSA